MKPIACWHHGNLERLLDNLSKKRIDLWGRNEKTEKGWSRLDYFWNRMRLKPQKAGENDIRIVVSGEIVA